MGPIARRCVPAWSALAIATGTTLSPALGIGQTTARARADSVHTVEVVRAPELGAGWLQRWLLGEHHRYLGGFAY